MESDTRIALVALLIVILIVLGVAWLVPRLLG
jgi:flagellar biogenesis protein FliO